MSIPDMLAERDRADGVLTIPQALSRGFMPNPWTGSRNKPSRTQMGRTAQLAQQQQEAQQAAQGDGMPPPLPEPMQQPMQQPMGPQPIMPPTGRPAGEVHGAKTTQDYYRLRAMQPKTSVLDTIPHAASGMEYKAEKKGRTSGLSEHFGNQSRLALERGARAAIDPITGMSQTPTEREMAEQIAMLAERDINEAILLASYYEAKKSGNPEALAQAARAMTDHKNKKEALRLQSEGRNPVLVNEAGTESFKPEGQPPQVIPGGERVIAPPVDGKIIPADKTKDTVTDPLASQLDPDSGRQLVQTSATTGNKAAPQIPATEPSAIPTGRTASMMTPYGKASATYGPRTTSANINWSNTYDPNFLKPSAELPKGTLKPSLLPTRQRTFDDSLIPVPPEEEPPLDMNPIRGRTTNMFASFKPNEVSPPEAAYDPSMLGRVPQPAPKPYNPFSLFPKTNIGPSMKRLGRALANPFSQ